MVPGPDARFEIMVSRLAMVSGCGSPFDGGAGSLNQ